MTNFKFNIGDSVIVTPNDADVFQNEFSGIVKSVRVDVFDMIGTEVVIYSVVDGDDDVFDVYEEQLQQNDE